MKRLAVLLFAGALLATPALAQEGVTVSSLLAQGYEIKGVMPSNAGPGILLQKGADLVMCFVAETAQSTDIATEYCKPVH
jgi:hypothetical protein